MSSPTPAAAAALYWCYGCSRFVRASLGEPISCPDCHGGFLEEIENPPAAAAGANRNHRTNSVGDESFATPLRLNLGSRRSRRASILHHSPFNPVIVFRSSIANGDASAEASLSNDGSNYELFYYDGAVMGLRPLPQSMSDFLMGSGFGRLLNQLRQIENSPVAVGRSYENASKASIESLPTITIAPSHIAMGCCCAVCKEMFELQEEAREMPCKHIFHEDCIIPWLSLKKSCPVCRYELPNDSGTRGGEVGRQNLLSGSDDNADGFTIWRLPGGGFAVGRFYGARREGEREFHVVSAGMYGSFGSGGERRRISYVLGGRSARERRGITRVIYNLSSVFRCFGPSSSPSLSSSTLALPSASAELRS